MSEWRARWRAITKNALSVALAVAVLLAVVVLVERVMVHGYHIGGQCGFEVGPPVASARSP